MDSALLPTHMELYEVDAAGLIAILPPPPYDAELRDIEDVLSISEDANININGDRECESEGKWLWESKFEKEFINIDELKAKEWQKFTATTPTTELDLKDSDLELSIDEAFFREIIEADDDDYIFENKSLTQLIDCADYNDLAVPTTPPVNLLTKIEDQSTAAVAYDELGARYDNSTLLAQLTPPQSPPLIGVPIYQQQQHQQQQQQPIIDNNQHGKNYLLLGQAPIYVETTALAVSASLPATAASNNYQIWQTESSNINSNNNNNNTENLNSGSTSTSSSNSNNNSNSNEVEHGIQVINELLNTRTKELQCWQETDCESLVSTSLCGSESPAQSEFYQSASSRSSCIGHNDDEEWLPMDMDTSCDYAQACQQQSLYGNTTDQTAVTCVTETAAAKPAPTKKRTRPYGRAIEDRKIRKKEQNKKAATRYRQKKKQEMELVLGEEHVLLQQNEKLQGTLESCQREVKYLRKLLREFYKNKPI